ncbi:MAG: hypothetical protein HY710_09275 [Candidatus Latescibacteria bacterium]|nr:hypothetical protein [Candidatus Latescibacterota bacterium]
MISLSLARPEWAAGAAGTENLGSEDGFSEPIPVEPVGHGENRRWLLRMTDDR